MATLTAGNSKLFLGALGNVRIEFNSIYLGLTTEDTTLTKDEDVKDIMYSQKGTKPSDHIPTGILYRLSCVFGEINTSLYEQVLYSFSTQVGTPGVDDDSGTFGVYLYQSLRDEKAKKLKIHATDSDGVALTNAYDIMNFYEAVPIVNDNVVNWGADTQRNLPVDFMIYPSYFGASQVSGGPAAAFGYYGLPATELVPDIATYPS